MVSGGRPRRRLRSSAYGPYLRMRSSNQYAFCKTEVLATVPASGARKPNGFIRLVLGDKPDAQVIRDFGAFL